MYDPFNTLPSQWFNPDSPFLYWFVTYIFGPAFAMGSWGLAVVALAHILPLGVIFRRKWQSWRARPLWQALLRALGWVILVHLFVGLLFWLLLPLIMMLFYRP